MDVPEPGTPSPFNLPPPPLKSWGWSSLPYMLEWLSQTAHFLGNHSRQFGRVKTLTSGHLQINENLDLFVAGGWQISVSTNFPPAIKSNLKEAHGQDQQ